MPFASFNPTIARTDPWNFGGNFSAFGDVEKLGFFKSAILNFFSKFFFVSSQWKQAACSYHLFLQYGWFLHNIGKGFIRTNKHTTVLCYILVYSPSTALKKTYVLTFIGLFRSTRYQMKETSIVHRNIWLSSVFCNWLRKLCVALLQFNFRAWTVNKTWRFIVSFGYFQGYIYRKKNWNQIISFYLKNSPTDGVVLWVFVVCRLEFLQNTKLVT